MSDAHNLAAITKRSRRQPKRFQEFELETELELEEAINPCKYLKDRIAVHTEQTGLSITQNTNVEAEIEKSLNDASFSEAGDKDSPCEEQPPSQTDQGEHLQDEGDKDVQNEVDTMPKWRAGKARTKSEWNPEFGKALLNLPTDLTAKIMGYMSIGQILIVSQVCKTLADTAELIFEDECKKRKWRAPRHPRGAAAGTISTPWRALYKRHACQVCGNAGEFPVRRTFGGVQEFLVCKKCAHSHQGKLAKGDFYIDLLGLTGKRLLKKPQQREKLRYRRALF